ncbi:MAG: F390 synthetase-related protein [Bacteroidota bacterium]
MKLRILLAWLRLILRPKWRSREELLRWQEKQLKQFEQFLGHRSPYFQQLMKEGHTIDTFPLMDKTSFMTHFNEINTVGLERESSMELAIRSEKEGIDPTINGVAVGLSTGTSGNRGMFVVSPEERANWAAMMMHRILKPRLFQTQRIAFILRATNPLYESIQSRLFQFRYYELPDRLEPFVQELNDYQPHILTGQPSVLRILAEEQAAGRLTISPHQVISYAEVLEPDDQHRIQAVFEVGITNVYQCTEGFLATTCEFGTLHLNEDIVRIEKKYVSEGRFQPIVTDFRRKSQPVVRYLMNDILVEATEPCPCGSPCLALAGIEGRTDEVLLVADEAGDLQRIFPDQIRRAMVMSQDSVRDYRVVQTAADRWEIFLEVAPAQRKQSQEAVAAALHQLCLNKGLVLPELTFLSEMPPSTAVKRRRITRPYSPQNHDSSQKYR